MLLWQSVILGIIEGLTEFLPISSTFHLLFASRLLGIPETEFVNFFTVFIQGAAILAVAVLYFREWLRDWQLLKNVLISFIPTAIVGFALHKIITTVFFSSQSLMLGAFIITGLVFIALEVLIKKEKLHLNKTLDQISWPQALFIGLLQAAAVLPGVSRAGAVIVIMMLLGYRRDEAAKYSFTLAIPTILGAAVLDLVKTRAVVFAASTEQWTTLALGCVAAFVSALVIVRWFVQYLRHHSLTSFGIYRFIMAASLLLLGLGK